MNFFKKAFLFIFPLFLTFVAKAQYGGWASYSFLKLPSDAFTTSVGGQSVAPISNDPSLYLNNPALNDSIKKQYLKINFAPLWAVTSSSTITYGKKFNKLGNISASLQYLNYGTFQGTDAAGNLTNSFNANDFALTIGHARKVNNISIGANLKFVGSSVDTYSAYAVLVDFGGYFKHPKKEISYGLAIKNMGARIKNFTQNDNQNLPFDVQMGFTIRPEQMPLRFSINAHHLHQWIITNDQTDEIDIINNQIISKNSSFANKLASHFVFGVEAFVHQNLQLNFGYNHLLRKELKFQNQFTFSGFSFGFLLKTKKMNFGVGRQGFHSAGGLTQFSIFTNLK
jgi:hypothetical protein